jgi:hypothetical protein
MTYMPAPGDARPHTVTLIPGDGIGPEVTSAVIAVVEALKAPVVWERFDSLSGATADGKPPTTVPAEVLDSIRRNKVCLKGTLFTPLSKKNTSTQSLNVQLRKDLDLVVNLVRSFCSPSATALPVPRPPRPFFSSPHRPTPQLLLKYPPRKHYQYQHHPLNTTRINHNNRSTASPSRA